MGEILKAPEHMLHPRDYVAPSTDNAQTEGTKNVIIKLSQEAIFNNASQGTGIAGPAVWGQTNESNGSASSAEAGSKQSDGSYTIDPVTGQNSCWAGGRTKSNQ